MALRNAFENLALDSTLKAVRDALAGTLTVDVSSRAARTLGRVVVDSVGTAIDVADRAGRVLGVADVSDRASRVLGGIRLGTPAQLASGNEATMFPGQNSLRVTMEPTEEFIDFFDGTSLDPIAWTSTGPGVVSNTARYLQVEPGTAANALAAVQSVPTFQAHADGYTRQLMTVIIGGTVITGNYRYWGLGRSPATPTLSNPISDGVGFEVRTDGTMHCAMYVANQRVWSQQITRPTDGQYHRYIVQTKASGTLFFLDDSAIPVARASLVAPGTQQQPIRVMNLNGSQALTAETVFRFGVISIGDTGRNSQSLSDGRYPHRKARIDEFGALLVSSANRRSSSATPPGTVSFPGNIGGSLAPGQTGLVVPANPNRLSLVLQNFSADEVYVGYGGPCTLANGIRIAKSGGQLLETNYTGAIYGIADNSQSRAVRYIEVSLI